MTIESDSPGHQTKVLTAPHWQLERDWKALLAEAEESGDLARLRAEGWEVRRDYLALSSRLEAAIRPVLMGERRTLLVQYPSPKTPNLMMQFSMGWGLKALRSAARMAKTGTALDEDTHNP